MSSDYHQRALAYLRKAVGRPDVGFRDGQWEAIRRLLEAREPVVLVQRTGWGKSYVYFVATRLLRDEGAGPTLVVSPLLALMRDQIRAADQIGLAVYSINSTNQADWKYVEEHLRKDEVDVLLISPERLANEEFARETLPTFLSRVGLLVIDEAHCVSDWGHDFRPDYRRLSRVIQNLPAKSRLLAMTATANERVISDIVEQIGDRTAVLRGSLDRPSLILQNIALPRRADRLAWLAQNLPSIPGSGIIYVLTKRDAEDVASWLNDNGIPIEPYYSGIENREELEAALLENRVKALAATTALGMGFDKPDVGFVIHYQRPQSVIHYYQQVGRAGRALPKALGILFSGTEDNEIAEYFIESAFPDATAVEQILDLLRASEDGLTLQELQNGANVRYSQLEQTLKVLETSSPPIVARSGRQWFLLPGKNELDWESYRRLRKHRYEELEEMDRYVSSESCLLSFLRKALDDLGASDCGRCSVCVGNNILSPDIDPVVRQKAQAFVGTSPGRIEPRKQVPYVSWLGFSKKTIPSELRPEAGRYLSRWNHGTAGELVKRGKQRDGEFSDRLVDLAAEYIGGSWKPEPFPELIVPVPSRLRPELVPRFARHLADRLSLEYLEAVVKTRDTRPQKSMQNSAYQARNVEQSFEVDLNCRTVIAGRCILLVDDLVDSRWTATTIAVLLKKTEARVVYPFALGSTASS